MDAKKLGMGLVATATLLIALFSTSWWSMGQLISATVGLRKAEICMGQCVTQSIGGPLSAGGFGFFGAITFWVGLVAAGALGLSTVAVAFDIDGIRLPGVAKGGLAATGALAIVCAIVFPGGSEMTLSWGFFACLLGCGLGIYALSARASFEGTGVYVPVTTPGRTASPATSSPLGSPTPEPLLDLAEPPVDTQAHSSHYNKQAERARASLKGEKGVGRGKRVGNVRAAATDVARSSMRFACDKIEIGAGVLMADLSDGSTAMATFADIKEVIARRMPPDDPWDKLLFVDVVLRTGKPLRILPSTRVNYDILPGGADATARANMKRLGVFLASQGPTIEAASQAFFNSGQLPPAFPAAKKFAEYDARFPH